MTQKAGQGKRDGTGHSVATRLLKKCNMNHPLHLVFSIQPTRGFAPKCAYETVENGRSTSKETGGDLLKSKRGASFWGEFLLLVCPDFAEGSPSVRLR